MEDSDERKFEQLSHELQVAAINLMNHLRTNHVRIRIKDTLPELYITLGEGRHASGIEATEDRPQQNAGAPATQGVSSPSVFAKLRKALAA